MVAAESAMQALTAGWKYGVLKKQIDTEYVKKQVNIEHWETYILSACKLWLQAENVEFLRNRLILSLIRKRWILRIGKQIS